MLRVARIGRLQPPPGSSRAAAEDAFHPGLSGVQGGLWIDPGEPHRVELGGQDAVDAALVLGPWHDLRDRGNVRVAFAVRQGGVVRAVDHRLADGQVSRRAY